jgi:GNAT superfamily N-acetyltransferase
MPGYTITLTDAPSAMAQKLISDELDRFNEARTGVTHSTPLAILVKEPPKDQVVGGLLGHTSLNLFFVDLFFLPERMRCGGLGSKILLQAEAEAVRRNCQQAVLYTIAFQASDFYKRHGYQIFGEILSGPKDQARIFMTKKL